jgi:acyl-CoA reductase-like NAD-dependent aldehyde dehydrogenase
MTEQRPARIGTEQVTTTESMEVRSPYDDHLIATVASCGPEHVERAVAAAKDAMADPLPTWQRAEILDRGALAMVEHHDELARLIAEEAAKPIRTARGEADRSVLTFQSAAAAARTLTGQMVPMDATEPGVGKLAFTLRVPRGVVGAISPFNFPLNLVAHKLAPAIAAGCAVVLKPAGQTPLSALRLVDILVDECGLPAGWINVVTGSGRSIGDPLVTHDDVAVVTFTGSPEVGWSIAEKAARKHVGLELGNNAPLIIDASGDWRAAAEKVSVAGYSHAGQSCISTQRVYVHRSIEADFTDALAASVAKLQVGDPLDEATDVSSLISTEDTERVSSWVRDAVSGGAKLVCGGNVHDRLLDPVVLQGIEPDMDVSRNEVFGPVVGIAGFDDIADAIGWANDTTYGLQAAVYTSDLAVAMRAATKLDFGGVLVNEVPTFRADQMPYGGVRDSGNTKEGPAWSVREMTRERLVILPI